MTRTRLAVPVVTVMLLLAACGANAASQKIFRCGPDGRVYSQTPCKDGYEVDAADPRDATQRKAAEDVLKRDAKLVEQMRRERLAAEAAAARQSAARTASPARAKAAAPAASGAKPRRAKKPAAASQP